MAKAVPSLDVRILACTDADSSESRQFATIYLLFRIEAIVSCGRSVKVSQLKRYDNNTERQVI
jgi:hypothetical protein